MKAVPGAVEAKEFPTMTHGLCTRVDLNDAAVAAQVDLALSRYRDFVDEHLGVLPQGPGPVGCKRLEGGEGGS